MSKRTRTTNGGGGWKHWTEAQARTALEDLARSGASVSEFSRSRGFSTRRIAYWKKRLRESASPAFVSVTMPPSSAMHAPIEIVVGDVVVRVRGEAEAEQVARIVDALARRERGC